MGTMASNKAVTELLEELTKKGIVETPKGSNRTWIGKVYGWNGVPWCAETQSVALMILNSIWLIGGKTALARDFMTRAKKGVNGMKWISHSRDAHVGDYVVWSWGRNSTADHVSRIRTIDHSGGHAVGTTHGGNEDSRLEINHRDFRTVAEGGYALGFARPAYGTVQRRNITKVVSGWALAVALGASVVAHPPAKPPAPKPPTPVVVVHQTPAQIAAAKAKAARVAKARAAYVHSNKVLVAAKKRYAKAVKVEKRYPSAKHRRYVRNARVALKKAQRQHTLAYRAYVIARR